jgi:hypothetical protein
MTGYQDGADHAYRNDERYGPYKAIHGHFPTPSGDLLHVALTEAGDIRVFRNGEDLSGPIADARTLGGRESSGDGGALTGYHFARQNGPFVHGYIDKGETHVFFGEKEVGHFTEAAVPTPRTSPDGRHFAIYRQHPEEPLLRSAEREVRLFNDEVIGTFRSVPAGGFSVEHGEMVFVGAGEDGQTLYRGRTPAYAADRFLFTRFAAIAGTDRLVARISRDGREYLVIDEAIAGPFDEVLMERASLDGRQADGFVFHSRTGRDITRHRWHFQPLPGGPRAAAP